MNERLDLLRKRLAGKDRTREDQINWKAFWIGSPTAWLALLISLVTAFYTFVFYSDEAGVVIDNTSVAYNRVGQNVHFAKAITVVNSGTSPLALLQVRALLAPSQQLASARIDSESSCMKSIDPDFSKIRYFDVPMTPVVVKAGDTGVVPISQPVDFSVAAFPEDVPFVLCLQVHFVASHQGPSQKRLKMPLMVLGQEHPPRRTADYLSPQLKYIVRRNLFRSIED